MEEDLKKQIKWIYEMMASEELSESIATMYWNIFVKMKAKGFTDQQAIDILSKFNLGNSSK